MTPELKKALRRDFESFVRKAHGEALQDDYIEYLCYELGKVARGITRRLVVNLPPRHLKTFASSVCLSAFILGRDPSAKVLIITYGENLAVDIAHNIREILRTKWFRAAFATRLAADRNRTTDFATTEGGGVYAVPIYGQVTGYGADYIIIDDPLEIRDANNLARIEAVNDRFEDTIRHRFDRPSKGTIVIVAHRLHENDLCGHVAGDDEWTRVVLPFEATRSHVFDLGNGRSWRRTRGELLRPDEFTEKDRERIRKLRNFHTLYQQDPSGTALPKIEARHFVSMDAGNTDNFPGVISVDPGQGQGDRNCFGVIQLWRVLPDRYLLADQWRNRASYIDFRRICQHMIRRHRPSAAIVESAGTGVALLSELRLLSWLQIWPAEPSESKIERLRAQVAVLLNRKIALPADAAWRRDYIAEFVEFPNSKFTDQIDATTQFLQFMATEPVLLVRSRPAVAQAAYGSRPPQVLPQSRHAALAIGPPRFWRKA
jgi:phage terminase large subunit-like protein